MCKIITYRLYSAVLILFNFCHLIKFACCCYLQLAVSMSQLLFVEGCRGEEVILIRSISLLGNKLHQLCAGVYILACQKNGGNGQNIYP